MKIRSWCRYITILSTVIFIIVSFSKMTFSATPGTIKWKISCSGPSISIDRDGTIYIHKCVNGNQYIYAINPNGTIKWKTNIRNAIEAMAIDKNQTIYISTCKNNKDHSTYKYLYAINHDGTIKWKINLGYNYYYYSIDCLAIGKDNTIYIPINHNLHNYIYAISDNGTIKWKTYIGSTAWNTESIAIGENGTIYAIDQNEGSHNNPYTQKTYQYIYAINPNGTIKWKTKLISTGDISESIAIGKSGTIYALINNKYSYLYAINPNGTIKWKTKFGYYNIYNNNLSIAIGKNNTIYIPTNDLGYNYIYAINNSGTIKWKICLGYNPIDKYTNYSIVIGKNDTIYAAIGSNNYRALYAIDTNGDIKWKINLDSNWIGPAAIGNDGTIYVITRHYLYAINSNSAGLANSPWPKFQHDNQNTGNVLTSIFHSMNSGNITITPDTIDFGNVTIGNISDKSITIINNNDYDCYIDNISINATYKASFKALNATSCIIPAHSKIDLKVECSPTLQGEDNTTLYITIDKKIFNIKLKVNSIEPLMVTNLEPLVHTEKIVYNPIVRPDNINLYFIATFNKNVSNLVNNSTIANYLNIISISSVYVNTYVSKILDNNKVLVRFEIPTEYVLSNPYWTLKTETEEKSIYFHKNIVPVIYRMSIYPEIKASLGLKWGVELSLTLLGQSITAEAGADLTGTAEFKVPYIINMEYYDSNPIKQYFSIGYGIDISSQTKLSAGAGVSTSSKAIELKAIDVSLSRGTEVEALGFPFRANVANDQYQIACSVVPFIGGAITQSALSYINLITQGKPFYSAETLLSGFFQFDLSIGQFNINLPILDNKKTSNNQTSLKDKKYTIKIIKPSDNSDQEVSKYLPLEGVALYNKEVTLKLNFKLSKNFYTPYDFIFNCQLLINDNSGPSWDIFGNHFQYISTIHGYGLNYRSNNYNNNSYIQFIAGDSDYTYYNNIQTKLNNLSDSLKMTYKTMLHQLLDTTNGFTIAKHNITDWDWEFLDIDVGAGINGELGLGLGINSYWQYPKSSGIYKENLGYLPYYKLTNDFTEKQLNTLPNPLDIWLSSLSTFKSDIENLLKDNLFGIITDYICKYAQNTVEIFLNNGKKVATLLKDTSEKLNNTANQIGNKLNSIGIEIRNQIYNHWPIKFDPRIIYLYPKNNQYNTLSNIEAILYPEDDITADNATLLGVYRFNGYGWQYVDSKWDNKYKGYKFKLTHYGYYALIYNFSNDINFMQKHIINLKPQQSTILYSREIKLANNATAANVEFEIQPYKCASIEGNYTIYGKSPVVIPKTIKTDQYGILHIPVKAIAEGEAFYKIKSKYGYAYDIIRIVVSKNKGIDPNFKVAIQLLYNKDKMVPVNATVTMKAITSYNSTSIKWYIKTPGNDVIKKGSGYSITFTPIASSVYKVICMATDKNGFWHTAYALLPVTNPNKDSDGDGISDNVEKFFGLNPKDPSDGKKFISAVENSKNCFIKIISGQGTIENVKKLPARYFDNIPNNLKPICIYNYTVNNMSVGGSVELQALFNITNLENYKIYRFVNNRWIDISDQVSYNTDSIAYYLTDGGKYDDDGLANGKIEDTIMIAKKIATATWQDITSALNITKSRPIFDRHHRCFLVYVNIKNTSGQDIYGPIRLVITNPTLPIDTNCPLGMQVAGKTSNGNSYFEIIPKGGVLKAGASTGNLRINFKLARKRLSFGVAIEQLEQIGE